MAQKRMFDKLITNSDDFLDMPVSSQVLYFHLSMNADDDGFINNWKSIMRLTGTKEDDLKILIMKRFIILFNDEDKTSSGIIVIKHWRINNYLRSDRYKKTQFQNELKQLKINSQGEYELSNNDIGIPMVYPDKNRIDKNSIDYISSSNNIDNYIQRVESIYEIYENEIGTLNSRQYEELKQFKNKLPDELIIEAINRTSDSNGKNFNYLRAILNTWSNKGYKTLGDLKNEEKIKEGKSLNKKIITSDSILKPVKEEQMSDEELKELEEEFNEFRDNK